MFRGLNPDDVPVVMALHYSEHLEDLLERERDVMAAAASKAFGG